MEDGFPDDERGDQGLAGLGSPHCFPHQNGERVERYSRKVFVGGLPPDIDEGKVVALRSKGFHFRAISLIFGYDWNLEDGNLRERFTIRHPQKMTSASQASYCTLRYLAAKSEAGYIGIDIWGIYSVCLISDEITASFRRFGHLFVDWPHKAESKSYFPPKGMSNHHHILVLVYCFVREALHLSLQVSDPIDYNKRKVSFTCVSLVSVYRHY